MLRNKWLVILFQRFHGSSHLMTNLRNLCTTLMKHLNPFSDDCSVLFFFKHSGMPILYIVWNISRPHLYFFRSTRRRRPTLSLRMRRTSRPLPACVWPEPTLVSSAFAPRGPKRQLSRTWRRKSENSHYGTWQNKVFKKSNVRLRFF